MAITPKLKRCAGCGNLEYIYKQHGKERYSKICWEKKLLAEGKKPVVKQRTPIAKMSDKRQKLNTAYLILRTQFLKDHPHCFAQLKGICTKEAQDCHHLFWGKDREANMNDFSNIVPICRPCHTYTHSVMSKTEAIERGLKKVEENGNKV